MSSKLMGQVWELDLPRDEQSVLLAMADNAHDDGTHCYPGVDYLAWKTGYDRRSVQRILRKLEEPGLIVVLHAQGGRGLALDYNIDISKGKKKRPWQEVREELRRQKRAASCHPLSDPKGGELSPFEQSKGRHVEHERVTPETERVTSDALKGDTRAAPTIKNQEEPSRNLSPSARSASPPAPSPPNGNGARERRSQFTYEQRLAYARNRPGIDKPEGYANSKPAREGDFDEAIAGWYAEGKPVGAPKPRDTSACPDCAGKGHYFTDPTDPKTFQLCSHPRLGELAAARGSP